MSKEGKESRKLAGLDAGRQDVPQPYPGMPYGGGGYMAGMQGMPGMQGFIPPGHPPPPQMQQFMDPYNNPASRGGSDFVLMTSTFGGMDPTAQGQAARQGRQDPHAPHPFSSKDGVGPAQGPLPQHMMRYDQDPRFAWGPYQQPDGAFGWPGGFRPPPGPMPYGGDPYGQFHFDLTRGPMQHPFPGHPGGPPHPGMIPGTADGDVFRAPQPITGGKPGAAPMATAQGDGDSKKVADTATQLPGLAGGDNHPNIRVMKRPSLQDRDRTARRKSGADKQNQATDEAPSQGDPSESNITTAAPTDRPEKSGGKELKPRKEFQKSRTVTEGDKEQTVKSKGLNKQSNGQAKGSKKEGQSRGQRVSISKPEPVPIIIEDMPQGDQSVPPMTVRQRLRTRLDLGLDPYSEFEDSDIADSDVESDEEKRNISLHIQRDHLGEMLSLEAILDEQASEPEQDRAFHLDACKKRLEALDRELLAVGVKLNTTRGATKRIKRDTRVKERKRRKQWIIDSLISDTSSDGSDDEQPITEATYRSMLAAHKHLRKRQEMYRQRKDKITAKCRDYTRRTLVKDSCKRGQGRKYRCTLFTPVVDISSDEESVDSEEIEEHDGVGEDTMAGGRATPVNEIDNSFDDGSNEGGAFPSIKLILKRPKFVPIKKPKTEEELRAEAEEVTRRRQEQQARESEDRRRRLWQQIVRRDIPKAYSQMVRAHNTTVSNARKYAQLCQKELLVRKDVKRMGNRSTRMTKETQGRARRLMKEVLGYWRKHEKEERENRRKAEKEALERQKMEDEMREAKRQQRKLNFLITQTELYAHFMGGKMPAEGETVAEGGSQADGNDLDVVGEEDNDDDEDDESMRERAKRSAEAALRKHKEKTQAFDEQAGKTGGPKRAKGATFTQEDFDEQMNFANPQMATEELLPQPTSFAGNLKSYQIKGMSWLVNLYDQGINGILADEMGLGKTVQTIALLSYLADYMNIWGPFLIVAPLSTVHNWQQEFEKFNPSFKVLPYWGKPEQRKLIRKDWTHKQIHNKDATFHVLITSYNFVVQDDKYFQRVNWQYMILDEAQAIKSSSSTRWKTLLAMNCRNRLLLTGTPIQNSMAELWALLHFIMPTLFDSHDEFNEWFSKDIESHAEKNSGLDQAQLKRLHMILKPFMLRRLKRDVQHELGEKIEIELECGMTAQQRRMYEALRDKIKLEDLFTADQASKANQEQMNKHLMNLVMQFRKVCNHPNLFERKSLESPFVFSAALAPFEEETEVLTGGRNNFSLDVVSTNKNPIACHLPKLLFTDLAQMGLGHDKRHLLYNMLSIMMPEHIHRSSFPLAENHVPATQSQSADGTFLEVSEGRGLSFLRLVDLSPAEAAMAAFGTFAQRVLLLLTQMERFTREYSQRPCIIFPPRVQTQGLQDTPQLVKVSERLLEDCKYAYGQFRRLLPKAMAEPIEYVCSSRSFAYVQQHERAPTDSYTRNLLLGLPNPPPPIPGQWWSPMVPPQNTTSLVDPMINAPFPMAGSAPLPDNGLLLSATPPHGWTPLLVPDKYSIILESNKMMAMDRLLATLKIQGHRVLIYSQMTRMIDLLEEYMQLRQHKYMRLDGSTKVEDRRDMVADFQSHGDVFAFLLSTRAGGLGINLTAADTVIFYDSDWNPTVDQQAMDRAHRVGQTRQVTVYRMVTKGTIEERILQRARQKSEIQAMVISGGNYRGNKDAAPKTSEVVSLLIDDKDLEEKFRRQKAEKKRQEKEAREGERARKKEKRREEIERRREEAARRRQEARAAKARPRKPRKRATAEGDAGGAAADDVMAGGADEGSGVGQSVPGSRSDTPSAFTPAQSDADPDTLSVASSAFTPTFGKPVRKRGPRKSPGNEKDPNAPPKPRGRPRASPVPAPSPLGMAQNTTDGSQEQQTTLAAPIGDIQFQAPEPPKQSKKSRKRKADETEQAGEGMGEGGAVEPKLKKPRKPRTLKITGGGAGGGNGEGGLVVPNIVVGEHAGEIDETG